MLLIIVFHCPEVFIPHMAADFGRYPHAQSQQPCDLFSLCCSDGQDTDTKARKQLSDWEYTSVPPLCSHQSRTHSRLVNFSPFFTSTMLLGNQDVINVTFTHIDACTKKQKPSFNAPGEPLGCVFDATNIKVTGVAFVCQC